MYVIRRSMLGGLLLTLTAGDAVSQEPVVTVLAKERNSPSARIYEVVVEKNVPIPMRDGTELMADIYFPAEGGRVLASPLGTLLQRTPYNKASERMGELGERYASKGYAVLVQDVRGRHASGGKEFKYGGPQAEDGFDTVEWIARQDWSNGNVGTFGASTPGQNQNSLATLDPPGLKAMVVAVAGADYSELNLRQQGSFQLMFFEHQYTGQILDHRRGEENPVFRGAVEREREHFRDWLWRFPIRPGLSVLKYFPENEEWFFNSYTYGDYPGPDGWWLQRGFNIPAYYEEHADVATIYIGSWFDNYALAQSRHFAEIARRKPETPKYLFFHPLGHTEWLNRTWAGDVDFGSEVLWDFETFRIKFYDRFVKGIDNNLPDEISPVTIFVMGGGDGRRNDEGRMRHGGSWRYEEEWPIEGTQFVEWYFSQDGTLDTHPPSSIESATSFQYDPDEPVPSVGSHQGGFRDLQPPHGPYDQRCDPERFMACTDHLPLETRHDVLVFKTPPLEEAIEVIGPIEVKLWVSSDAPDTDFTAKLIDEYPPNMDYPYGFQMYLAKGIARMRYWDSREEASFLEDGEVYRDQLVLSLPQDPYLTPSRLCVTNHPHGAGTLPLTLQCKGKRCAASPFRARP